MEINKSKQILVIERFIEVDIGDYTLEQKCREIKYNYWYNIANHDEYYLLKDLFDNGWQIKDTVVSTSICCSQSGYTRKQDHTILTLEK